MTKLNIKTLKNFKMKKLKQLSRKEMKSVSGAKGPVQDPISDVECGCTMAACVTGSNKDGSSRCSNSSCC